VLYCFVKRTNRYDKVNKGNAGLSGKKGTAMQELKPAAAVHDLLGKRLSINYSQAAFCIV